MAKRIVQGLKWARALPGKPGCIPTGRPRGAKALGARYEKALAKQLGAGAKHGCWYEFEDAEGRGFCQTDFELEAGGSICVLEVKFTWSEQARVELEKLYLPVVAMAKPRAKPFGIVVCQRLVMGMKEKIGEDWGRTLEEASEGRKMVWQWLPKTPFGAEAPHFSGPKARHQVES